MSERITSAANPLIKDIRALVQKKHRDENGQFLLEGSRDVTTALAAGWQADFLLATEEKDFPPTSQVRRLLVTPELMGRITGRDNPPALLAVLRQRWAALTDVTQGLWVGLEDIRDPGNLGTIIRTAVAAGARGVLLIGECCDPFSPEAVRASVGTLAHILLARCAQGEFLVWRPTYKSEVIATHLSGSTDYRSVDYRAPCLLLFGTEQSGLTPALTAAATQKVRIPMRPEVESLNVAVAAALILYQIKT